MQEAAERHRGRGNVDIEKGLMQEDVERKGGICRY